MQQTVEKCVLQPKGWLKNGSLAALSHLIKGKTKLVVTHNRFPRSN